MWQTAKTAGKILLGVGFVLFLLYKIDPEKIWLAAITADPILLGLGLLLLPLNIVIETAIWKSVTDQLGVRGSWSQLLQAVMAGFALGAVTPARVGEFAGRSYFLEKDDRWKGAFSLALSRQPELLILGICGCVGLAVFMSLYSDAPPQLAAILGIGIIATLFVSAITARPVLLKPLTLKFGRYFSFFPAHVLVEDLAKINLGKTLVWSAVRYVVFCAQFMLLARAFGIDLETPYLLAIIASIFLIRFVIPPITFMDLGIREGASVFLFGIAGISQAAAFNSAFLLFAINIALPALLGVYSVRRIASFTSLKR